MKILLRTFVRILEGIAIALVLVTAVVFIQLARGPLPLDPLVPYVESSLNRLAPDYRFAIADAELTWQRLKRRPELTVNNVQVRNAAGATIAAFGALDISLDMVSLIGGRLVVEHLGVERPVVRIVRAADGHISLGLEAGAPATPEANTAPSSEAAPSSGIADLLIDALRVSPDDAESGPMLESVEVTQSTIVVIDQPSGVQWLIPDANLRLLGQRETIEIAGNLPLVGGAEKINVDVAGRYTYAAGLLSLTASFDGVRPAAFAAVAASLEPLKAVDAAVKGSIEVNVIPDNLSSDASWGNIVLNVGPGALTLPADLGGAVVPIGGAEIRAATSGGLDQIALDKFELRIARTDGISPVITATGRAMNLRTAPDVDLQARIDAMTLQALKDLWPVTVKPNTRNWIDANLNGGAIRNVNAEISLGGADAWSLDAQDLKLRADLEGVAVTYIKGMPKVENTAGVLNVGLKEVTVDVTGGVVPDAVSAAGLRIGASKLRMFDLGEDLPKADFLIKITGDLGEALRLIDNEPLKYASAMQVDPNTATGNADVDLSLKFPLLSKLSLSQLQIGVKATVAGTRIENVLFGMPLTEGDLALDVVNTGLKVTGTAKLGPIPTSLTWTQDFTGAAQRSEYFLDALVANDDRPLVRLGFAPFMPPNIDGAVRTAVVYRTMRDGTASLSASGDLTDVTLAIPELGWRKEPGLKAEFTTEVALKDGALTSVPAFKVTAENDLDVQGAVNFGPENALKDLKITTGRAGRTDLTVEALKQDNGRYVLGVAGPVFDAQYFWKELNKDESRRGAEEDAEQSPAPDQTPVTLTAAIDEMWLGKEAPLKDVALLFDRNRRVIQRIDLKSKVESGASFDFTLTSNQGVRTLAGQSADGGGVVKSLGLFDDIKGGALSISGTLSREGAVEGKAEISDFKLVDAPLVARILSVAALTGIADELRGEGISFKTLRVPFNFSSSTLRISDAEMFGSSLGLTAQGSYRFTDSEIDMEGTVVPAYALNSALNAIPIVGTILTGTEKGGGIFAANFSWRGPAATAEPSVNPLSVLTPGITRKIFSIFGGGGSSNVPPPKSPQK